MNSTTDPSPNEIELVNFIGDLLIFRNLPPAAVQALATCLTEKRLQAGEVLFRQGDAGDALYIIYSGRLSVYSPPPCGSENPLKLPGPREYIGEMALLNGLSRDVSVSAIEETHLLRLAKTDFDRLAEEMPNLIPDLTNQVLPRFREDQARLALSRVFGQLSEADLRELQAKLGWRHLDCGQVLCCQGEPGEEMYIVVQGRLRFSVEENGIWSELGEVGAGESVGEFALLAEHGAPESRRSATIVATRMTDVIVINRSIFESLLCQQPQILLELTRRIIRRELLIAQSALPGVSAQVITIVPIRPDQDLNAFTRQFVEALSAGGPTLALDANRFDDLYGKPGASQTPLDHPTSLLLNTWLDEREQEHRSVLYLAQPALDELGQLTPWAQRCVEDADILLLVGESGSDPAPGPVEAALLTARTRARRELVLLQPAGCQIPSGTLSWLAPRQSGEFPIRAHHQVRSGNPADFRRLSRRLSDHPVGLTLGGGGARGWAHIGAIQAIIESGLEVDWVGGASMGAIIAAAYALDWQPEQLRQLAGKFSDPKKLLDYTFPYASATATKRITTLLQELCGETRIEDTWRPFFCVSANLTRGEEKLHTSGLLWKAIRASMAFPGIFAPILDEGCVLIDGGAANNLPIDRMRELCPNGTVIGVDLLTSSPTQGDYNFGSSLSGWQALATRLNPFIHTIKAPTLLDIVGGVVYSNNRYRLGEVWRCADLLIKVPVEAYGLLDFNKYLQIIELGYTAAKDQLKNFTPIEARR